jgi:parallel beta-helix repeat protein
MNKLIRAIFIMLMMCLCTLSIGGNASDPTGFKNTIYVNDDNFAGPWDGTEQHPYRHIQDAIDHAAAMDFITVANGTYYEHLIIKSHLIGLTISRWINPGDSDTYQPTLIGNNTGTGIAINASNLKITQLNITHYGQEGRDAGIYVETDVTGVNIYDNIISNSYHGIWIKRDIPKATYHTIEKNVITHISERGVSMVLCDQNKILSNTVSYCDWGVYLHDCYRNIISENMFSYNTESLAIDVGAENQISLNTFTKNSYGLGTVGTRSSTISKNNFIDYTEINAYFITFNVWNADIWSGNYWGRLVFPLVKPIPGTFALAKIDLPWIKFDFFPSLTPN